MERFEISVEGAGDAARFSDFEALSEWFGAEPELRGMVRPSAAVPGAGELGAMTDVLVAAVGSGGVVTVLAASLKTFFSQPRGARMRLVITRTDGTRVALDADRVSRRSVAEVTELLLGAGVSEVPAAGAPAAIPGGPTS